VPPTISRVPPQPPEPPVLMFDSSVCFCVGHFVPSKGQWRKFLVNWMRDPTGAHPSPSQGADAAAAGGVEAGAASSGAGTPIPGEVRSESVLAAGELRNAMTTMKL
jgi:hypothetical protein